jgi:hypothetical protein
MPDTIKVLSANGKNIEMVNHINATNNHSHVQQNKLQMSWALVQNVPLNSQCLS